MDEQKERQALDASALSIIYDFLTAQIEMKSGQLCLFPFYDFNIIPVELISTIFEILLGREKRESDMAFFTPEYLTDYIIQCTVRKHLINVTFFSLYITLFDYQDPKDLKNFKLPLLKGENTLFGDFFDDDAFSPIKDIKFNYILGNPPWGRVKQDRYKEYWSSRGVIPPGWRNLCCLLTKSARNWIGMHRMQLSYSI